MKKFCRDKVMNVATLKDKVSGPDIEINFATSDADLVNRFGCNKRVQCCDILQS